MKSLTLENLQKLLSTAKEKSETDALMYLVGFNHGLRISELLKLTAASIVGNSLVVQRLKGSKRTAQPLHANERDGLLTLASITTQGSSLFKTCSREELDHRNGKCGCRRKADRHFKKVCAKAGVNPLLAHCHTLRHTCAMMGLKGGMKINELQTYLGHKSGASTMVYLQVSDDVASQAFAAALAIGGTTTEVT